MSAFRERPIEKLYSQRLIDRVIAVNKAHNVPAWVLQHTLASLHVAVDFDMRQFAYRVYFAVRWWDGQCYDYNHLVDVDLIENMLRSHDTLVDPTPAMDAHLSARGTMHMFRLNQHFPKRVKSVTVEKDYMRDTHMIRVIFTNGHSVVRPEEEVRTKDFLALCAMLYDLPPKGED